MKGFAWLLGKKEFVVDGVTMTAYKRRQIKEGPFKEYKYRMDFSSFKVENLKIVSNSLQD